MYISTIFLQSFFVDLIINVINKKFTLNKTFQLNIVYRIIAERDIWKKTYFYNISHPFDVNIQNSGVWGSCVSPAKVPEVKR